MNISNLLHTLGTEKMTSRTAVFIARVLTAEIAACITFLLSTCRHFAGKQPAECKGRNLLLVLAKNLQLIHLTEYRTFGDLRAVVGQEYDNETIVHSMCKLYVASLKRDKSSLYVQIVCCKSERW